MIRLSNTLTKISALDFYKNLVFSKVMSLSLPLATLPLSGAEPIYEPTKWNSDSANRKAHNCYAYFLQDNEQRSLELNNYYPQPGAYALHRKPLFQKHVTNAGNVLSLHSMPSNKPFQCSQVRAAVLADNPSIYTVGRLERCISTHYKGFLAVDSNADDSDYHFWIQNRDGLWSHKPGETSVRRTDSSDQIIYDPLLSDRGRYDTPCCYFCVPKNSVMQTHSRNK